MTATPETRCYVCSTKPRSCPAGRVGLVPLRSPVGAAEEKHRPRDVLGRGDLLTPGCRGDPWISPGSPASQGPELAGEKETREVVVAFRCAVLVSVNWYLEPAASRGPESSERGWCPRLQHAMKSLRLPIAGGQQAIFGTHGCRISSVTCPYLGTCRGWASSPCSAAQRSLSRGHMAPPPCWQHHVAAATSTMPRLVPSLHLAAQNGLM